jgi:hypothetical protein
MHITMVWLQLVVGVSYPLLENTTQTTPHLPAHWLSSIRSFLGAMEASIHLTNRSNSPPVPLREGDVCIMDAIISLPDTSKAHLRVFNHCRIFLGVGQLSEIASANGMCISCNTWDGSCPRVSPLLWPYQPIPGPKPFRVWRRLLATAFLKGHIPRFSLRTLNFTL